MAEFSLERPIVVAGVNYVGSIRSKAGLREMERERISEYFVADSPAFPQLIGTFSRVKRRNITY